MAVHTLTGAQVRMKKGGLAASRRVSSRCSSGRTRAIADSASASTGRCPVSDVSRKTPTLHQLEQEALTQTTTGDAERKLEQVRDRLEDQDSGREQPHALRVELEALGHLRDGVVREHADAALERLVLQLGAQQPAQRGGGAADRDGAVAGGGSRPSKVPATWRRTFSSSSAEGGSERR